ncbi:hypothetical protein L2E82_29586 [Cichorium intybus]|uniref:Uncharacterized protein n=1 Tax=Cichorium intybus TaxID=13427 RepID=A0ACB9CY05_CICIN|nr:hypothetical protein L2E82_29586 [Cichorium intybus]
MLEPKLKYTFFYGAILVDLDLEGRTDPRDYFDSQQVNAMNELAGRRHLKSRMNTCQAYGSLRGFISKITSLGLSDPVVRPEVDVKVFNGLTQTISSSKYQLGKNPHENILYTLPTVTKDELLLVSRLKDAMSQIYTKLQEIKESVQSDSMHHVSLLVQPMLQPLDAAFAHYDEDQHKRSAQAIDKPPNGYGYDLQPADIQNIRLTYSDLCTWVPESKFRECLLATLALPFQLMLFRLEGPNTVNASTRFGHLLANSRIFKTIKLLELKIPRNHLLCVHVCAETCCQEKVQQN